MEELLKELLENKQIIDFPKEYYEPLGVELRKLFKSKKIKQYQIGNIGDCGYCAFIDRTDIAIPCRNSHLFALAC